MTSEPSTGTKELPASAEGTEKRWRENHVPLPGRGWVGVGGGESHGGRRKRIERGHSQESRRTEGWRFRTRNDARWCLGAQGREAGSRL